MTETKTFSFEVNGHYRPVALAGSNNAQQHDGRTADFSAHIRQFVIVSATGGVHYGNWMNERAALRTCASYPRLPDATPTVHEVPPYWYAPAFGRVAAV